MRKIFECACELRHLQKEICISFAASFTKMLRKGRREKKDLENIRHPFAYVSRGLR